MAGRILEIVPGGVDAVVDAAGQKDQVTSAVKPGGAFVSFRGWTGNSTDGERFEVVSVRDEYLSHDKLDRLRTAVEQGAVTLRTAGVMPADEAAEAHRLLEAGGTRGRFVLTF